MIIIPEFGLFCLIAAFCMACLVALSPVFALGRFSRAVLWGHCAFVVLGFLTLMVCFAQNNFSVEYVALNSNTQLPFIYKLCAVWGAHEGSLLLWIMILSLWMMAVIKAITTLSSSEQQWIYSILGAISTGFLFLLLHTSNPFARVLPAYPLEGVDLNPLLQDPGFIIHPPFLYMGYVGFAIPFAFSIAALIHGNFKTWVLLARPFALIAWGCLTIGIVLGSWWAYYELGWGGWWFWDPVENASLMPWLMGGALCHTLFISSEHNRFVPWSHLLAIATFILSLMGTFLVRSGLLSSVHAFAADPKRGSFILAFIFLVMVASFALYSYRYKKPKESFTTHFLSRESCMLLGNVILVVMTLSILLGTLYPLAMEVIAHKRLSVGPPYFNAIIAPLMVTLILIMIFGPYVRWHQDTWKACKQRFQTPHCVYFIVSVATIFTVTGFTELPWYTLGGVALGGWLIFATLLSSRNKGMFLAHIGLGVFVIGVVLVNALQTELETMLAVGESVTLGKKEFIFDAIQPFEGSNFEGRQGHFIVKKQEKIIAHLFPEKRYFPARETVMTETAISPGFWEDYYIALGERYDDNRWSLRIYIKPFVRWIWLGGLLIALGALYSGTNAYVSLKKLRKSNVN